MTPIGTKCLITEWSIGGYALLSIFHANEIWILFLCEKKSEKTILIMGEARTEVSDSWICIKSALFVWGIYYDSQAQMCKQCIFHLKNNHTYYTLICMKSILFHWGKNIWFTWKKTRFFLEKNHIFHMWICLKSELFHFKYSGPLNRTNIKYIWQLLRRED